ncbi:MAG TPA: hypothetical protein VKE93_03180 [Candidatus Angelobacter sp.]|nr:hypothetical protein [Candidatus Angelobacter sp.]
MRRKCFVVVAFWLSVLALGQGPIQNQTIDQQFETRRQNFATGRQLLLNKGLPFDPDELLHEGWRKNLKSTLDAMPEMHQARYETAPLKDVYMADTLYLPENVQLSGHTVILANYVVFEGKNPVIRGNFDVHFFPTKPVVVLETTLAELLHKKGRLLNVSSRGKLAVPSFLLIQDLVPTGTHNITIDVSGAPFRTTPAPPPQKPAPKLKTASWRGIEPVLFPQKNCTTSCDNNGDSQPPAGGGSFPGKEALGSPNFPGGLPAAPSGSCNPGSLPGGSDGNTGGKGVNGDPAGQGQPGLTGNNAGSINVDIANGDTNQYTFNANGGRGQQGGQGGPGGTGGDGGQGQAGGDGASDCSGCIAGDGGDGGKGGEAGMGGLGGPGGPGGNGGNGGTITGTYSYNGPVPNTSVAGGPPGAGGAGGDPGVAGIPGAGGPVGNPGKACGITAKPGTFRGPGANAGSLGPGAPGANGTSSGTQGSANLTPKAPPPSGGGGGGDDPCPPFNGNEAPDCSPIIIDTEREGFHLTSAVTGVAFDISGTGKPVQIAWTDPHFRNAFLALPGSDGLVHSGKELFGNFTSQPQSAHPNGFIALAQFDKPENGGNGDGIIDEKDEVFSKLRLWIDENHDGICQPQELHRLPELGVFSLDLNYSESRRTDQFGNQFRYKSRINPGERKDARDHLDAASPGRWTYDVFLVGK